MVPKVSIIMATYNRAHLIAETLECISSQSFKSWECLIIDDGSEDKTAEIVGEFNSKDDRFLYFKRKQGYKKGLPGCRNQGIDMVRGELIVFFDDDDIPHPQLLELSVAELQKSQYDFCRFLRETFKGDLSKNFKLIESYTTEIISLKDLEAVIQNKLPFNSCQVLWRKARIGMDRFEESLMYAEEWEFYSRLLLKGLKGVSINEVLYFGRKHPNSNTGEFQRRNPVRINSQIEAAKLVIENLSSKNIFNEKFKVFFLRMGFELNSLPVVEKSLKAADSTLFELWKYKIGYKFYPILKPIFYLKGKITKS